MSGLSVLGAEALSSGINFVGNLGGSVSGGLFGANQARKNRAFQERMYNKQVQDTIDFWKMQQDFNLPSAQLQRIRDAGLSPLLLYGEGGISGNVASSQPSLPSAPHGAQAQASSFNTRIDMANLALVEAQARLMNTEAKKTEEEAEGQSIFNWINDQTKNVQIALKYGDYDYVKQLIAESCNRVFQSSFVNASEMASLSLMNELAIRKQNLTEYEVGNNVMQGWEAVLNGRISANAQFKSAAAAMMNAVNAAKLVPFQIGVMRATAYRLNEEGNTIRELRPYQVKNLDLRNYAQRRENSWIDILHESDISEQQSRIFINSIQKEYTNTLNEYKPIDEMMAPFNLLTGFGAGLFLKGSPVQNPKSNFRMPSPYKKPSMNPYE